MLLGMTSTSLASSWSAGLGGFLFLLSDGLILLSQAKRMDVDAPYGFSWRFGVLIMPLYIAAIFLITVDSVAHELEKGALGSQTAEVTIAQEATLAGLADDAAVVNGQKQQSHSVWPLDPITVTAASSKTPLLPFSVKKHSLNSSDSV